MSLKFQYNGSKKEFDEKIVSKRRSSLLEDSTMKQLPSPNNFTRPLLFKKSRSGDISVPIIKSKSQQSVLRKSSSNRRKSHSSKEDPDSISLLENSKTSHIIYTKVKTLYTVNKLDHSVRISEIKVNLGLTCVAKEFIPYSTENCNMLQKDPESNFIKELRILTKFSKERHYRENFCYCIGWQYIDKNICILMPLYHMTMESYIKGLISQNKGIVAAKDRNNIYQEIPSMILRMARPIKILHSLSYVHGDIKLDNYLFSATENGNISELVLSDFETLSKITRKQPFIKLEKYTVDYTSPERLLNENADFSTDIWSFAIIIYIFAALRMPYDTIENSIASVSTHILGQNLPEDINVIYDHKIRDDLMATSRSCLVSSHIRPVIEDLYSHLEQITQGDNVSRDCIMTNIHLS
jgi:hypothetical protein